MHQITVFAILIWFQAANCSECIGFWGLRTPPSPQTPSSIYTRGFAVRCALLKTKSQIRYCRWSLLYHLQCQLIDSEVDPDEKCLTLKSPINDIIEKYIKYIILTFFQKTSLVYASLIWFLLISIFFEILLVTILKNTHVANSLWPSPIFGKFQI